MVSRNRVDEIMGEDRTRTRFIDATGGMNANAEPWKVADNEYPAAENMILEGDGLVSRGGSLLVSAANATGDVYKAIAEYTFYDRQGVLTLCVVAAALDSTTVNYHVFTRTTASPSVWSEVTISSGGTVTSTAVPKLLNFKNRMIICDGVDRPKEYNRNDNTAAISLLGIDGPNRKKYLCDFYPAGGTATLDDPFYTNAPYAISLASGASLTALNAYTIDITQLATHTNSACLKLTGSTTADAQISQAIAFTNNVNLTQFLDGSASDDNDYIVFTVYFENMLSMKHFFVDIDTYSASAWASGHGYWRRLELTQAILNANDWGGAPGNNNGRYFVKLTKQAFLDSTDAEDLDWTAVTDAFSWATVKRIRFGIETIATAPTEPTCAYVDLVGMEESPPIVSPSEKVLRSFDPQEAWSPLAPSGMTVGYDYTTKTQGFASYKATIPAVATNVGWGIIQSAEATAKDWGHWAGDEEIKQSDFVAIDIYNDTANAIGIWLTLRFLNGSGEKVGVTKGIINALFPEGARLPMVGILKAQTWTTIYVPLKFMMQTFWLTRKEVVGEYEEDNHLSAELGNPDTDATASIGGGTDAEVAAAEETAWAKLVAIMSAVRTVQIGAKTVNLSSAKLKFDNLRLCRQHLEKGIASFNSVDVYRALDVPGIAERMSSKYPLISEAISLVDRVGGDFLAEQLMLGETWNVDGVQNEDDLFDYQIKTSLLSCLKMEIKGGDTATATLAFSPTLNLNSFGLDIASGTPGYKWARFKKLIAADTYIYADGFDSDISDVITFDAMVSNISSLDFAYIVFTPTSAENGDYFAFDMASSDLSVFFGLSKARNNKWMSFRVHKSDFIRYGTTAGITWGDIATLSLIIGTKGSDTVTVRIDNMNLKSSGALKGQYYYKVLYRGEESVSRPSEASLVLPASQVDAYLDSIPVSSDTRVLYKDIYRMGGDAAQFKLVDTIGNAVTTYVDKKMDNMLGPVLDDNNYEPPVAACMWEHRNRLWFGNTKLHTSRVLWSRSFNPTSFPIENYMDVDPNINGVVTGGISRGDDQLVFKTGSISKIVESGDRYWDIQIPGKIGCDCPNTICKATDSIYWIHNKKAYRMDGDRVDEVFGHKVKPMFAYADSTAAAVVHGERVLFAVKRAAGSTVNDVIISYNTVFGKWESVFVGSGYDVSAMFSSVIDGKLYGAKSALSSVLTPTAKNYLTVSDYFTAAQFNIVGHGYVEEEAATVTSSVAGYVGSYHVAVLNDNSFLLYVSSLMDPLRYSATATGAVSVLRPVSYGTIFELLTGTADNHGTGITDAAIVAMITPKHIPGYEKRVEGFEIFVTSTKTGAESAACLSIQPIIDYLTTNTLTDTFELGDSVSPQIKSIKVRGEDVANFLGVKISCSAAAGAWKYLMSVFEYIIETDQ